MELTKITGIAKDHFSHIQYNLLNNKTNKYWYNIAKIRCVYIDERIMAWGLVIQQDNWENKRIWLYTDAKMRRKGLQKTYVLPFFSRYYPNCLVQTWYEPQKQTFKYYKKEKTKRRNEPKNF